MSENILDQMARLVIENPSITVKEMAEKLKYSQEKSIYYWLEKADYRGIKEFKEAVFRDYYEKQAPAIPSDTSKATSLIPLLTSGDLLNYDNRNDLKRMERTVAVDSNVGKESFAVLVPEERPPVLEMKDVLVVDPTASPEDGDLVLVRRDARLAVCRVYGRRNPQLYIDPVSGKPIRQKVRMLGKITRLIRTF